MDFEWDDAKAESNVLKHGVDFLDAIGAVLDPNRLEEVDTTFDFGEERVNVIGMTHGRVLFVVITVRDEGRLQNHIGPEGNAT